MFAYLEFIYIFIFVIPFVVTFLLLLLLSYSSQNSMFAKLKAQNKKIIILENFS